MPDARDTQKCMMRDDANAREKADALGESASRTLHSAMVSLSEPSHSSFLRYTRDTQPMHTTVTCHNRQMSQPSHVTTVKCHNRHMSQPSHVTTVTCHNRHMSQPSHVTPDQILRLRLHAHVGRKLQVRPPLYDLAAGCVGVVAEKWRETAQHFKQHATEAPQVCFRPVSHLRMTHAGQHHSRYNSS